MVGKFDITLKDIFYGDTQKEDDIPQKFVEIISGKKPLKLLPPTLPAVKDLTADLVIGLEDRSVLHNVIKEGRMPIRIDPEKVKETDWFYHLGEEKGKEKKLREDVIKMFKNLKLSPEQISKGLEVPLEEEGLIR